MPLIRRIQPPKNNLKQFKIISNQQLWNSFNQPLFSSNSKQFKTISSNLKQFQTTRYRLIIFETIKYHSIPQFPFIGLKNTRLSISCFFKIRIPYSRLSGLDQTLLDCFSARVFLIFMIWEIFVLLGFPHPEQWSREAGVGCFLRGEKALTRQLRQPHGGLREISCNLKDFDD